MAEPKYPKTVTAAEAEAFFRNPANFTELYSGEIYKILGFPDDWADWDLGREYGQWCSGGRKVRIYTDSRGHVCHVELLRPKIIWLFGSRTEVLWHVES